MNQFVHWNQLLAHALSFVVFYFLVRMAFAAIIYPPMKERREKIKHDLGANGIVCLFTNPERNRNNDCDFRFRADSDFLYLTGFEEPDSALLLAPGGMEIDGKRVTEVLFVNESNKQSETWLGYRMGPAGAMSLLGVQLALPNSRFAEVVDQVSKQPELVWARPSIPPAPSGPMTGWIDKLKQDTTNMKFGSVDIREQVGAQRVVKSPEELVLLRKAASASALGHIEAMRSAKPGMREFEIQALVEYVFARSGCESVAYNSIVGSGPNSTILHYEDDRRLMKAGDIVCMDVAGEYHGYAADVTRSYPVSGKYSPAQREIYEIVLAAQAAGIKECRTGHSFLQVHQAAAQVLGDGLLRLGIIKSRSELGMYFMHGTSHYVGLDVHDYTPRGSAILRPNTVLTVEPGIYIKEGSPCDRKYWNIGVRIEDDILVTTGDPDVLSQAAPRKPEEIEALMAQQGIGNLPLHGK